MRTKLLIVAPYFPEHTGGLERYALEVAQRLNENSKWQVTILTTSETGRREVETKYGLTIHRLPFGMKISNTPFSFSWLRDIRHILRHVQADVVNVHTPVPGIGDLVAWLLPKKTPLIVTYHTGSMHKRSLLPDILIWLYEHTLLRHLLNRARHIICASDFVRYNFLQKYAEKSSTITPAVDSTVFTPDLSKQAHRNSIIFVAGLGVAEQYKGLATLIDALVDIKKVVPSVQLTVVGDGDMRKHYMQRVAALDLSQNVTFVGVRHDASLVEEYQRANLLVLPTEKESFGMVIAEAMASGLAVVSTNVGGVPSLVEEGVTGFLIEPGDRSAITDRVLTLLHNPSMCDAFGRAGRERVATAFTWGQREAAYLKVLEMAHKPKPCIAHIVGYHPPHLGGMEVVADEVATELSKRGYPVRVFTSDLESEHAPHTERKSNYLLRRLRSFEVAHTPLSLTLPYWLLRLPKDTILHVHVAQAGIPELALLIAKLRHFRFVAHFHLDVEPSGKLGRLFVLYKKHVLGRVLRNADVVLVFSKEQENLVREKHGVASASLQIIPNGVAETYLQPYSKRAQRSPLQLLAVSRLTVQKRLDRLIRAMALLTIPAKLTILGDGEDRDTLEKMATSLCPEKVQFEGFKKPEQVRTYHGKADVFVIPSNNEGMPLSVLEAMAASLPIVGSNVLGIRELVDGVGILVNNPSPESFAAALTELYGNEEHLQQLSKNSRKCAEAHTWGSVVSMIEQMYKKL